MRASTLSIPLVLLPLLLAPLLGCPTGDGGGMVLVAEGMAEAYLSARAGGPDDVWVVGSDAGAGPALLRWDGAAWDRLDTAALADVDLWWVWPGVDVAWAVGSKGAIVRVDRATGALERVEGVPEDITFFGIWGAAADDLWAVGGAVGGGEPAAWRNVSGQWEAWTDGVFVPGSPGQLYFKVHGTTTDDVWIVGTGGLVLHWNGELIDDRSPETDDNLLTVDVDEAGPVVVGGLNQGLILQWDQDGWLDRSPAYAGPLNGVCRGAGQATAVGGRGAVYRLGEDGWVGDDTFLTNYDYHGCLRTSDGALWAVGGHISSAPLDEGVIAYEGPAEVPSP